MPADYVSLAMQLCRLVSDTELAFVENERGGAYTHLPTFTFQASSKLSTSGETVTGIGSARALKDAKHEAARDYIFCLLSQNRDAVLNILDHDHSISAATLRPPNPGRNGPSSGAPEARVHTALAGAKGLHAANGDEQGKFVGSPVKNGEVELEDLSGQLRQIKLEGVENSETFNVRSDGIKENHGHDLSDSDGEFVLVSKADVLDFINNKMKPFDLSVLLGQQK